MISVNLLVGALDTKRDQRARRSVVVAKVIGGVFLLAMSAGMYALGYLELHNLWLNPPEFDESFAVFAIACCAFIMQMGALAIWGARLRPQPRTQQAALVLRELAARSDEQIAPLAKLQPRRLEAGEIASGPLTITPIRFAFTAAQAMLAGLFALLIFFLIFVSCGAFAFTSSSGSVGSFPAQWFALIPIIFIGLYVGSLLLTRLPVFRQGGASVVVDEQGIAWRRRRQERRIAWNQARSLAQVVYTPLVASSNASATAGGTTTYILETPDEMLLWHVMNNASDAEFAAAELLLRHAVTRTGLPLRDISDLANDVAKVGSNNAARMLASRVALTGADESRLGTIAQAFPAMPPKPRNSLRGWLIGLAFVILLTIDAALPLAYARMTAAQARYSATLLARSQQMVVFQDSLAADDGEWPVQQATKDHPQTFAYADGAYHLSGAVAGQTVYAWQDGAYGDAAYAVTVSETGALPANDTDGVGLMFHADYQGNNFIALWVQSDGYWNLAQYNRVTNEYNGDWTDLDSGYSSAIIRGIGAQNRLAVITQGQFIRIYANDQLVEVYHPTQYDDVRLLTTGYAGVFSNEAALTATFSDFSIARVPSPEDFWQALLDG